MKKRLLYMLVVLEGFFPAVVSLTWKRYPPQNKLKPNTTDDYDQLLNYGYLTDRWFLTWMSFRTMWI